MIERVKGEQYYWTNGMGTIEYLSTNQKCGRRVPRRERRRMVSDNGKQQVPEQAKRGRGYRCEDEGMADQEHANGRWPIGKAGRK